jgi:hypothetical protein
LPLKTAPKMPTIVIVAAITNAALPVASPDDSATTNAA